MIGTKIGKADWYKGRLVQRQIGTKIGKADWYKGRLVQSDW